MRNLCMPAILNEAGFLFYRLLRQILFFVDNAFPVCYEPDLRKCCFADHLKALYHLSFFLLILRIARRTPIVLYAGLFFLLVFSTVQAEIGVAIIGTVCDSSGTPLSGVSIRIPDMNTGTITNWNGRFNVSNLRPGDYHLEVSHIGYEPAVIENVTIFEGSTKSLDIRLRQTPLMLQEVEIFSHTKIYATQEDGSIRLSNNAWRKLGANSVGEVLRHVPGITVLEGDGRQRVSLYGSPPRAVRVDLDGIPLNDAGTGEAVVDQIDLSHLGSIQIEPSGYGGEIHLRSSSPVRYREPHPLVNLSLSRGSFDQVGGKIRIEKSAGKFGTLLHMSHSSEQGDFEYETDDGQRYPRINNDSEVSSGNVKIQVHDAGWNLWSGAYVEKAQHGVPGLLYVTPSPEAELRNGRISTNLNLEGQVMGMCLESVGYFSWYQNRYSSPAEQYDPLSDSIIRQFPEENQQTGKRYGLTLNTSRRIQDQELRLGYEVQRDEYRGEDVLNGLTTVGGVGLGAAQRTAHNVRLDLNYQQAFLGWSSSFNPQLGVKWTINHGAGDYRNFLPGIAASISRRMYNTSFTIISGWGRNSVSPHFNALFLSEGRYAVGNADLQPENGESFNYGISLNSVDNQAVVWSISLNRFHRRTEDLIVWRRNGFGKYYPDNEAEVKSNGFEAGIRMSFIKGLIESGCNYTIDDSQIATRDDINQGNIPPLVAPSSGSAYLTLSFHQFRTSLNARWTDRRYSTASNLDPISTAGMGLPPYTLFDFFLSRSFIFRKLSVPIEFRIGNLFDRTYRVIERTPMPGRSFRVQLGLEY